MRGSFLQKEFVKEFRGTGAHFFVFFIFFGDLAMPKRCAASVRSFCRRNHVEISHGDPVREKTVFFMVQKKSRFRVQEWFKRLPGVTGIKSDTSLRRTEPQGPISSQKHDFMEKYP